MRALFEPVQEAVPNLTVLVLLAVGVWRIRQGLSATGDLVTVAYLLTIIGFPLRSIGWVVGEIPRSVVGERRVRAVLEETQTQEYGDQVLPSLTEGARVQINHLDYSYESGAPVLRGLDFHIEPGHTIALVGSTASGKSTLATLLMRLVDPDRGEIRVDGVDLRDLRAAELAQHAALVPQTPFLFDDTVRENIALGAPVSDEEIWAALDVAQATET